MSEPNVLVNFRLDKDQPLRLRWLATDGVPGDGYKAQITAIKLSGGAKLVGVPARGVPALRRFGPTPR